MIEHHQNELENTTTTEQIRNQIESNTESVTIAIETLSTHPGMDIQVPNLHGLVPQTQRGKNLSKTLLWVGLLVVIFAMVIIIYLLVMITK